jgi:predicted MFS family arabinose efflux permease
VAVGRHIGLEATEVGRIMALGLAAGLAGAFTARLLGNRAGVILPVVMSAVVLAVDLILVTTTSSAVVFTITTVMMVVCAVFVLPYFLTRLAFFGDAGRWASIGPAFFLSGVALGPSVGAYVGATYTLAALGVVAAGLILASACAYVISGLWLAHVRTVQPSEPVVNESISRSNNGLTS